jgi:hypothetical protein
MVTLDSSAAVLLASLGCELYRRSLRWDFSIDRTCLWRGRERLFAVNRGRKLFAFFPLKVFSGAKIASR